MERHFEFACHWPEARASRAGLWMFPFRFATVPRFPFMSLALRSGRPPVASVRDTTSRACGPIQRYLSCAAERSSALADLSGTARNSRQSPESSLQTDQLPSRKRALSHAHSACIADWNKTMKIRAFDARLWHCFGENRRALEMAVRALWR